MRHKKTIVHVNMHVIKRNAKTGEREPPLTVKTYKNNVRCNEAILYDDAGNEVARVTYSPDRPLSCGARVWLECRCRVEVIGTPQEGEVTCQV